MSSKKQKNKSLSEKVADAFAPQKFHDPENDSEDETAPKVADFDEEDVDFHVGMAGPSKGFSDIRKRNVKLLSDHSEKYKGKVSSRRELEEEDEEEESEEEEDSEESEDDALEEYREKLKKCQISDDNEDERDESLGTDEEDNEQDVDEESEQDDEGDSDYDSNEDDFDEDFEGEEDAQQNLLSEGNKNMEIQKGLAVQNQLKIWEKLLEFRIHSQKILTKANGLPLPDQFEKLARENENFSKLAKETTANLDNLLDKLLEVQTTLANQYSETKNIFKNSRKRPNTTSAGPPSKKYSEALQDDFDRLRPYRNSVLIKWDDRMKLLTPGAGAKKKSLMDEFDVIKKIDNILLNKSDLIEKSQRVKGNYSLFGQPAAPENSSEAPSAESSVSNVEIYDDTDFYHQQLRELIEFKSNTSGNSAEITKQFAELQKLRQKMKKKVDTRASKGRKIRYVVHNKLVNFMAPNDNSEWTDESKNELYRSLFAT